MESKALWAIAGISLLTAIASVLLVLASYSDNNSPEISKAISEPGALIFEIGSGASVYEIEETDISDEAWLKARREKLNELNAIRYQYNNVNEDELREDRKKSQNWSVYMNGDIIQGYDVIKMERGDFAEKKEPKRDPVRARAALARGYY